MKARIAAIVVIIYAVLLFFGAIQGSVLQGNFSIWTIPIAALLFIGPAVGVYRRRNWCRIYLGIWAVFVFGIAASFFFSSDFQFRLAAVGCLLASGFPVFLLFFYAPLKRFTKNPVAPQPSR